jgi:hypothetical protein
MTRESIIKFARQVGLPHWYQTEGVVNEALLIKFATLVAQQEREACAKVCEDLDAWNMDNPASTAIKAIRAMG